MDFAVALRMPLVWQMSTFPVSTSTDVNNLSRVGCQAALEAKWTGRKPTKPKRLCASVRSQALPSRRLWDLEMESEGHVVLAPLMLSTSAWSTAANCGDQALTCNLKAWVQCLIHTVLGRSYLHCFLGFWGAQRKCTNLQNGRGISCRTSLSACTSEWCGLKCIRQDPRALCFLLGICGRTGLCTQTEKVHLHTFPAVHCPVDAAACLRGIEQCSFQ